MQRIPIVMVENIQLPIAYAVQFTANAYVTISSNLFNNTSALPVTVSICIVPAAGSPTAADEVITTVSVPAAGAQPTILNAINGQHLLAGETLQMKAATAGVITTRICGYQTTL